MRPSPSEGPGRPRPPDDLGVSEVIGFLLIFAILSMVLVSSLYAFGKAQEATTERVVGLHADSIAQRIASVVVEASLFAETTQTDAKYEAIVDMPQQLEGRDFKVALDSAGSGSVLVTVPALDISVTAPLFEAGGSAGLICDVEIDGGPMRVLYASSCISLETLT